METVEFDFTLTALLDDLSGVQPIELYLIRDHLDEIMSLLDSINDQ